MEVTSGVLGLDTVLPFVILDPWLWEVEKVEEWLVSKVVLFIVDVVSEVVPSVMNLNHMYVSKIE